MRRPRRGAFLQCRHDAGCTCIELLEVVLSTLLVVWLAGRLAGLVSGTWRAIVYVAVLVVGTPVLGLSTIIGLAYVWDFLERRLGYERERDDEEPIAGEGSDAIR